MGKVSLGEAEKLVGKDVRWSRGKSDSTTIDDLINGLKETTGRLKKGLITFSPLAQGQLTDRYLNGIPEDSRIRTDGRFLKASILTEHRMDQIRKLNEMAAQRGEKLSEMALGWLLHQKEVTSVLIGADSG